MSYDEILEEIANEKAELYCPVCNIHQEVDDYDFMDYDSVHGTATTGRCDYCGGTLFVN